MSSQSAFVPAPLASTRVSTASTLFVSRRPLAVPATRRPAAAVPVMVTSQARPTVVLKNNRIITPPSPDMHTRFEKMIRDVQSSICAGIEKLDGKATFREDTWTRSADAAHPNASGGGGWTRVLGNGAVFEKAGVNVSVVHGTMSAEALRAASAGAVVANTTEPIPFFAAGISSVMHPWNPFAPTTHFNYRYFEAGGVWWYGGGTDLTPSYLFEEDAKHFHGVFKRVCDKHDSTYYPRFKKWCDEYFLIQHRGETRGIGGIFFDDFNEKDQETIFPFMKDAANAFLEAYVPIVEKRKDMPYTEDNKRWQQLRRGRYVEFNVIYDRGTIFGLKTGGRTESILMSLPLTARWEYDQHPAPGTPEAKLLEVTTKPREWL